MNAVERMVEYTSQPTEGSAQALTQDPPQGWPHAGAITIDNLQVRPLVLWDILPLYPSSCAYLGFFPWICP